MYYKNLCGNSVSSLGLGAMRLPVTNGKIDEKEATALIEGAIEGGINYFDTAYRYHDGDSERILGNILKRYPRKHWNLATKMPGHMMYKVNGRIAFRGYMCSEEYKSISEIFEEQLEKCQVDYFDYYLLHNVNDISYHLYADEDIGIIPYLCGQRKLGRIKHLGFSTHGSMNTIEKFVGQYDCFEFVQIQLNYYDWFCGIAKGQYELLIKKGLPVIVMEPCRGGKLANLPKAQSNVLSHCNSDVSDASWAFRFLQSLDHVAVVLSGMSDRNQLNDNLKTFAGPNALKQEQYNLLKEIADSFGKLVLCTGCSYCCEACPGKIPIPQIMELYNGIVGDISGLHVEDYKKAEKTLNKCRHCHLCEKSCPQGIAILDVFEAISSLKLWH